MSYNMQYKITAFAVGSLLSGIAVSSPVRNIDTRAVAINAYDYAGCFTEATEGRALTGKVTYDDSMTNERCAATCQGFTWFGTEYGREVCAHSRKNIYSKA